MTGCVECSKADYRSGKVPSETLSGDRPLYFSNPKIAPVNFTTTVKGVAFLTIYADLSPP
jgi:hypothetical protein